MKKNNMLIKISFYFVIMFFLVLGILSSFVFFHEIYHLVDLDGNPTGVCIGKCYIGSDLGEFAPTGITWDKLPQKYIDNPLKNEQEAWIFSIIINLILLLLLGLGVYNIK